MDLRFGARFTFGINTFYNTEVSDGSLDPEAMVLEDPDVEGWVDTALKAGMNYCLFTVKNNDGFCNWATRFSYYNIMNTPFGRDILDMLSQACHKKGLKLGLYYSLKDAYVSFSDMDQKFYEYTLAQLEELFTRYGPVVEIWFDEAWHKQKTGWDLAPEDFIHAWRMEGAYRYRMDYIYKKIKDWQPDCIVANNPSNEFIGVPLHPVDARVSVEVAAVVVDQKYWTWLGEKKFMPLEITINLSGKAEGRFEEGFWFFHDGDTSAPESSRVKEWLKFTARHNANLVLNCPITSTGKLREEDRTLLSSLWDMEQSKTKEE